MTGGPDRKEYWWLVALLMTLFAAALYRLDEFVVPEADEGVYVYAGKLIVEGQKPYRDFMLAHPPGIALFAAFCWAFSAGSLEATRWMTIAVTLGSCVPLYLLARRIAASSTAGLVAVSLYYVGLIWIAHLGRTVRIEPLLNAALITGVAVWLLGVNRTSGLWAGILLSAGVATKLVAVVPIAAIVLAELCWPSSRPDWHRRWLFVVGGVTTAAVVALVWAREPGFVEWVLLAQNSRPRDGIWARLLQLAQGLLRYPPLLPALACAAWHLRSRSDARRTTVALVGLAAFFGSLGLFNTFYRHYLAMALPFLCISLAVATGHFRFRPSDWVLRAAVFAIAALGPVIFTEASIRVSPSHSSAAAEALTYLRNRRDAVYTTHPSFALQSGRPLAPGYFIVDHDLPAKTGRFTDADAAVYIGRAGSVVLGPRQAGPVSAAVLENSFHRVFEGRYWEVWDRLPESNPAR